MTWAEGPLLAFDLETTAPNPDYARVVTSTLVWLDGPNRSLRSWVRRVREHLVNPGVPIPAGAAAIHGITTEDATARGVDPEPAIAEIVGELAIAMHHGTPVVGFNLAYDLTVLDRECRRHGIDTLATRLDPLGPVVDAFVLDKHVDPYRRGSRRLPDVCAHYGHAPGASHTSTADALAAARVAVSIAARHNEIERATLRQLHASQGVWRREQCASLQKYFRKTDPTAVVNGDWPVQALPDGWDPAEHPVDDEQVAS